MNALSISLSQGLRKLVLMLKVGLGIKLEKQASILHQSSVVSIDNIVCNINTDDIVLFHEQVTGDAEEDLWQLR